MNRLSNLPINQFVKPDKVLNLDHLDFDIVSDLELRISDFASLGISTTVEDSLQISFFMQNKPNLVRRRRIANEHKLFSYSGI
ncbi:MAG: hypothetical protein ACYS30_16145 [Planctomycetota bacterium]|jgi:hypothetical protein